ncbi:MAG: hypothetical protein ACREXW_13700 [Gammaproteobacteria bacterium]
MLTAQYTTPQENARVGSAQEATLPGHGRLGYPLGESGEDHGNDMFRKGLVYKKPAPAYDAIAAYLEGHAPGPPPGLVVELRNERFDERVLADFTFDETAALGKFDEQQVLREEMIEDAAETVLRRLESVRVRPAKSSP